MNEPISLVYITTKDKGESQKIAKVLLESRLVACANIFDSVESMYWWKDKIQVEEESVLMTKTRQSLVLQVMEKVRSIHSYEVPCIVSLPLEEVSPDFAAWILNETTS